MAQNAVASINSMDGGRFLSAGPSAAKNFEKANYAAASGVRANAAAMRQGSAAAESMGSKFVRAAQIAGTVGTAVVTIGPAMRVLISAARGIPGIAAHFQRFRTAAASIMGPLAASGSSMGRFLGTVRRLAPILAVTVAGIWAAKKAWNALAGAKPPNLKIPKPSGGAFGGAALGGLIGGAGGAVIGGFIVSAVRDASAIIKGTVGAALGAAVSDESLKIRMDVLVGDPAKATKLIEQLKTSAANTPLEFGDMAAAATQLLAFGEATEQVNETLLRVGDISTGVSAPIGEIAEIYGKARVQGTLFAEDINQLTGRGIPVIGEFAKILGVSEGEVKKLASEGKVTFPMLEQAFKNLTGEGGRFEGMMSRQSLTVAGKMSTLKDAITEIYRAFGAPVIDALKPILDMAIAKISSMKQLAADIGAKVADGILAISAAVYVLSQMDFATLIRTITLPLRIGFQEAVNFLYAGLVGVGAVVQAVFKGIGADLQNILIALIIFVMTGLHNAFAFVAHSFVAVLLSGIHSAIASVIDNIPGANLVLGGLASATKAAAANQTGKANNADALIDNAAMGLSTAISEMGVGMDTLGKAFTDGRKGAKEIFNTSEDREELAGVVSDVRTAFNNAKENLAKKGAETPAGDGTGTTAEGGSVALPAAAGRLAGAIATITGKAAGSVLQEKANSLLQTIATNTAPKPDANPPRGRAAAAMGTFS